MMSSLRPTALQRFAGDLTSHVVGWQEGAALSERRAVEMNSARVQSAALAVTKRPSVV